MSHPACRLPRRQFLAETAAFLAFAPNGPGAGPEPAWLWSGAVTPTSATVLAAFEDTPLAVPPLLVSPRRELTDARVVEAGRLGRISVGIAFGKIGACERLAFHDADLAF